MAEQKEDLLARLGTKEDKCSDYRKDQLALMAETHEREQKEQLAIMAEQKKDLLARLDAKEGRSMNDSGVSVSRLETSTYHTHLKINCTCLATFSNVYHHSQDVFFLSLVRMREPL